MIVSHVWINQTMVFSKTHTSRDTSTIMTKTIWAYEESHEYPWISIILVHDMPISMNIHYIVDVSILILVV